MLSLPLPPGEPLGALPEFSNGPDSYAKLLFRMSSLFLRM